MSIRNLLTVGLSFALVLCGAARIRSAQQGNWSGFSNLTLELAVPKESYLQLQPLPLVLTLSNKTRDVINGHAVLDLGSGFVQVWTRAPEGDWHVIDEPSVERKLVVVNPREIQPTEHVSVTQMLTLKLESIFPAPGTYHLKVRLYNSDRSQMVESHPVAVRISKPEGADLEAYNFIHTNANPDYFFTGKQLGRDRRDEQSLETFVAVFGNTAYGDDASFVLAQRRFFRGDYDSARTHFEKLAKRPDFVFAKRVEEYLRKIQEQQGKH